MSIDRIRGARATWWLLLPVAWVLAALVSSTRGGMMIANGHATPMPWNEIFAGSMYEFFWWMVLAPIVVLLTRKISGASIPDSARTAGYFALGLATIVVFFLLQSLVVLPGNTLRVGYNMKGFSSILPSSAAICIMMLGGTLAWHAFERARSREREAVELNLRASRLETQLMEAQLGVLRAQLQPHFLFNSLHAISTLVDWRPKEARRMIVRLSELLRMAIEISEEREITLAREFDWLERYLELQQIRFGDRLTFDLKASPETVGALIPPLILQPLVENALEHGVEKLPGGGHVSIEAVHEGRWLRLRVRDTGPGVAPESSSRKGVGLSNSRERLKTLYNEDQQILLRRVDNETEAIVELPWNNLAYVAASSALGKTG